MHASNTLAHIERTRPSPSFFANKSPLTTVHGHPPLHQLSPLQPSTRAAQLSILKRLLRSSDGASLGQ
jgi:hypothetical protein